MSLNIIYVLRLMNRKFYIGKTDCLRKTYKHYFNNSKPFNIEWITKNEPIDIEKVYYKDEDINKYTIKYMSKYSIDDVRGGDYTNTILSNSSIKELETKIEPITLKNDYNIEYYQPFRRSEKLYAGIFYYNRRFKK